MLDSEGQKIGEVTSGGPSPTLGYPIAMAYVDKANADDSEFKIDIRGKMVDAKPANLPFYKRPRS